MKEFLLKLFLLFVGKLDGYKTYISSTLTGLVGVGKILFGLVGIVAGVMPDLGFDPMSLEEGMAQIKEGIVLIGLAFGVAGIGHKIDKSKDAQPVAPA